MTAGRVYQAIFGAVGWFALGLQYVLALQGDSGKDAGELTLNFFSYFTVLVNILATVIFTSATFWPATALGRWISTEGVRAAVAMYIAVVGVSYHFLLSHVWDPQGWLFVANGLLHYVMPVAFVTGWLLFTPKGRLHWQDPLKWLSLPLIYVAWTLIHGYASDWWPYWFVNVPALGLARAGFWFATMLAFFLIVGLILVAIDRRWGRGDRSVASG